VIPLLVEFGDDYDAFPTQTQSTSFDPSPDNTPNLYSMDANDGDYGDQLVAQPKMIKTEYVHYARKPKRVDVQRLKDTIWTSLHMDVDPEVSFFILSCFVFNHHALQPSPETNEPTQDSDERHFSDVVQELSSVYTSDKLQDISIPFCFICLLHLANEKNLRIETVGEGQDLTIRKEVG
jgi:condensin complex subunit 2